MKEKFVYELIDESLDKLSLSNEEQSNQVFYELINNKDFCTVASDLMGDLVLSNLQKNHPIRKDLMIMNLQNIQGVIEV